MADARKYLSAQTDGFIYPLTERSQPIVAVYELPYTPTSCPIVQVRLSLDSANQRWAYEDEDTDAIISETGVSCSSTAYFETGETYLMRVYRSYAIE